MLKSLFFKHKPEQGLVVRGSGLAMIAALLLFGCYGLYYFVYSQGDLFKNAIGGWMIVPLVDLEINPALVVALVVFCSGVFAAAYFLGRPKTADLLIETETELAKVTWPSWAETVNASVVVIFTTLFMAGLLFVFDVVLRRLTGIFL